MGFEPATLSVIISGIVAIGALVISPLINLITDWIKWRREREIAEIQAFTDATNALVTRLSSFMGNDDFTEGIEHNNILVIFGELLKDYFIWESFSWINCSPKDREQILGFREKIQSGPYSLHGLQPGLTNEILQMSYRIHEKI